MLKELASAKQLTFGMLKSAQQQHRLVEIVQLKAWLAVILDQLGEFQESNSVLEWVVELGSREGYVHSIIDIGASITDLLVRFRKHRQQHGQDLEHDFMDEYLQQLFNAQIPKVPNGSLGYSGLSSPIAELLTEREMEVLKRLAEGHSNREMAEKMEISQSTVKYHLKNIYLKLGVHSRTQAIAHAGELRLI
jgi:LuxR family maltose regulon positive regulatory protein